MNDYILKQVKGEAKIHKNNSHFCIHKKTNSMVEAWDYRGECNTELMSFKHDYFWIDVIEYVEPCVQKFKKSDFKIVKRKNLKIDLNNYLVFQGENFT
tara:strand:+ start:289 stop:582 length:294 start_codon:yes stop_codon:yes gene_type:complete